MQGVEQFQAAMARLDSGMQRQVHSFLASWAAEVKAEAQKLVPVRTGHLRGTIYAEVKQWVVSVGAEAAYAYFIEFGTRYMKAQPYLYPAVEKYLPIIEKVILEALEAAKREAGL